MDKTFTREQYNKAVEKALDKFTDEVLDINCNAKGAIDSFVMGLQNVVFAHMIEKFLFGEEPSNKDVANVNEEKEGK